MTHRLEDDLLLCAVRATFSPEQVARLQTLLRQPFDADYLTLLAWHHQVTPLVDQTLVTHGRGILADSACRDRQSAFFSQAARNLTLTSHLLDVLRLCDQHGIACLPFKGPVLAQVAYGSTALRQFSDLDVLVRSADMSRLTALLLERGYQIGLGLTPTQGQTYLHLQNQLPFQDVAKKLSLEVHTRLTAPNFYFPLDFEELWARREAVPLLQTTVPSLNREDLLLCLCIHGAKHLWCQLKWICDITELLHRSPQLAWSRLVELARRLRSERMLLLGLWLADDLFQAPFPEELRQVVRGQPILAELGAEIRQRLFDLKARTPALTKMRFFLRVRERWWDGVRYLLGTTWAPNEADLRFVALSPRWSWLYYPLRPLRLLRDQLRSWRWRLGRRRQRLTPP